MGDYGNLACLPGGRPRFHPKGKNRRLRPVCCAPGFRSLVPGRPCHVSAGRGLELDQRLACAPLGRVGSNPTPGAIVSPLRMTSNQFGEELNQKAERIILSVPEGRS